MRSTHLATNFRDGWRVLLTGALAAIAAMTLLACGGNEPKDLAALVAARGTPYRSAECDDWVLVNGPDSLASPQQGYLDPVKEDLGPSEDPPAEGLIRAASMDCNSSATGPVPNEITVAEFDDEHNALNAIAAEAKYSSSPPNPVFRDLKDLPKSSSCYTTPSDDGPATDCIVVKGRFVGVVTGNDGKPLEQVRLVTVSLLKYIDG